MTKAEMITAVAEKVAAKEEKVTKKAVEAVLASYGEVVLETAKAEVTDDTVKDFKVVLPGVGTFKAKHVNAIVGRKNPLTGETYSKPAKNVLKFDVSKAAKEI